MHHHEEGMNSLSSKSLWLYAMFLLTKNINFCIFFRKKREHFSIFFKDICPFYYKTKHPTVQTQIDNVWSKKKLYSALTQLSYLQYYKIFSSSPKRPLAPKKCSKLENNFNVSDNTIGLCLTDVEAVQIPKNQFSGGRDRPKVGLRQVEQGFSSFFANFLS